MLAQRMGMAMRSGPACVTIRCCWCGRRRCRRGRDRASASNLWAPVLRTTTRLLCPAALLPAGLLPTGLLLWDAASISNLRRSPIAAPSIERAQIGAQAVGIDIR
jgi:hypothetical protein